MRGSFHVSSDKVASNVADPSLHLRSGHAKALRGVEAAALTAMAAIVAMLIAVASAGVVVCPGAAIIQ